MFKVGDRLIVTGTMGHLIPMGSKVTVLEIGDNPSSRFYKVADEDGFDQWVYHDDLKPISPPQKIIQNGYEYSLVGPVKPDWLVDGAWVVDKETGRKYLVSCDNGVYTFNNGTREVIVDFISLPTRFRPHTASDWKWGDWAMYAGRRVFVLSGLENASSMIAVTFPNIDSGGWGEWDKNHDFIDVSKLTPTF